jgi:starch phosphorylase
VARDQVVLASKVFFNEGGLSREAINREIDGTLARLSGNFDSIHDYLMVDNDPDLVMRDFHSYVQAWNELTEFYGDRAAWNKAALHNTAKAGYFSSDRTIREYMADIWHI